MYINCPFCNRDPYEYVDIGVGYERVAVSCCDFMIACYQGHKKARQILDFRRSSSPRKKARAQKIMNELLNEGWSI